MKTEDLAFWLSWCIEEYAFERKTTPESVLKVFKTNGVIDFLTENAEVLHTQGKGYVIFSIDKFLEN